MTTVYPESGRVHTAAGAFGGVILSATNASPIVCVVTAGHNLVTGDQVWVYGATTNTGANGHFTVTVTNSTTFSLDGSVGNGVYDASSGHVTMGYDVSGLTGDYTISIKAESQTALKGCLVEVQTSVEGFSGVTANDIQCIGTLDIKGAFPIGGVTKSWRAYELPQSRFGVASAALRLYVREIDAGDSVTLTLSLS
jgi:hypothetical protein